MRRFKMRHAAFAYQPFLAQRRHLVQRVEPCRMLKTPPVKLQQINPIATEPFQPFLNAFADHIRRHWARIGAPFGKDLRSGRLTTAQLGPCNLFRRPVVIRHVKTRKPRIDIGLKVFSPLRGINQTTIHFDISHLPEPD